MIIIELISISIADVYNNKNTFEDNVTSIAGILEEITASTEQVTAATRTFKQHSKLC
ncbi:hypothetical protein [Clostridium botulinum]|uniref:hypothetical protein n=1 Tax=Clostridium botulinum TaxID=1491 RepID=UPI001FD6A522|nr:hypothetical protein [Clostridium botulinum]MCJ8174459.1 hypothetical protein [Clostridium botulinum]